MTKYFIERYDTFNTKLFPGEIIVGNFNDQSITFNGFDFLKMMMTMVIMFLELEFTMPYWTTKEWKMQPYKMMKIFMMK